MDNFEAFKDEELYESLYDRWDAFVRSLAAENCTLPDALSLVLIFTGARLLDNEVPSDCLDIASEHSRKIFEAKNGRRPHTFEDLRQMEELIWDMKYGHYENIIPFRKH